MTPSSLLAAHILETPARLASDLRWQAHIGSGGWPGRADDLRRALVELRHQRPAHGPASRLAHARKLARLAGAYAAARGVTRCPVRAQVGALPSVAVYTRSGR